MTNNYVSDCCGGPVMTYEPRHEGGTGYYYCAVCGKGCEPVQANCTVPTDSEGEE